LANIMAALKQHAPGIAAGSSISSSSILPMSTAEDLAAWERLDDVIMVSRMSIFAAQQQQQPQQQEACIVRRTTSCGGSNSGAAAAAAGLCVFVTNATE
jgi:hypothetical protein